MQTAALLNANHPKKGSSIKVEPIKNLKAIKRIKKLREDKPRDYCFFTMGINTAFRANELLSLTVGQVNYLEAGDTLTIKQSKSGKHRAVVVNRTVVNALDEWLKHHPERMNDNSPLFFSGRTRKALSVSTVSNMVKEWCEEIGLKGNYGSHTMRKTWGFHQLRENKKAMLPILMEAYGHSRQKQTLDYLCVQSDEIKALYTDLEL